MTYRENMFAIFDGEQYDSVPIWLMGFENEDVARKLNPEHDLPDNLSHNPEREDYPWDRISDEERRKTINYNNALMKPVVVVGWGANMPLGHGGPGEFHFNLTELKENERTLICETGCKRLVKKNPHFYMDFDFPMQTIEDFDKLTLPDPRDRSRYKGFADDVSFFKESGFLTGANLNGFFSGPHYFCLDYQEFLMSCLLDPPATKKLVDTIGEWNIAAAEEMLARGVECIVLCDDLGSADNLLISPELYESWIFPWHKRLCDLAHEHDATVHLHSHGNINKILPLVLQTGVDMLDPFDLNESMDIVEFLNSNPDSKTIPVGGLHKDFLGWERDTQNEYLTSLFERAKKAGRWMLMDPGGISENISKETYDFLMNRIAELAKL
ncbi:uroporphyrinogen decarboxylase family protein [Candidatus Latescibacterota bacterium]